jgi:hypothetical protein
MANYKIGKTSNLISTAKQKYLFVIYVLQPERRLASINTLADKDTYSISIYTIICSFAN